MSKFFKACWLAASIVLAVVYLIASFSSYIPPARFSFISLLAIAFPYILLGLVITIIISFFVYKKAALLLLIALPFGWYNITHLYAFNSRQNFKNTKDSNTLRVMTWNVQNFVSLNTKPQLSRVRNGILSLIHEINPDVLCMQEYDDATNSIFHVSPQHILDSMGYHYNYFSRDDIRYYERRVYKTGCIIFSKTPMLDSGFININNVSRNENLAYTDIEFKKRKIRIFTAHLESFFLYMDTSTAHDAGKGLYTKTYNRKRVIQYKIRENEIYHQQQISVIRGLINQSPYPVIYCGDLNTTPASYNFKTLKGNLQDAFLNKGSGIGATFYKLLPTLRIDACFVDNAFTIKQCEVIQKKLSDHYPVVTDLTWK